MWFYLILLYTGCQACICICTVVCSDTIKWLKRFIKKAFEKIDAESEEQLVEKFAVKHFTFGQPPNPVVPVFVQPITLCI